MEHSDLDRPKFAIIQEISSAIVLTDNIRDIADLILHLAIT